jgi:hypothetical protein
MFSGRSFLMLLALLPMLSFAGERSVFQGTLEGVGTVVMELEAATQKRVEEVAGLLGRELETSSEVDGSKGKYIGRYFYARHGVDIPLFGPLERLAEDPPSEQIWQGKITQGHFRGQWVDTVTKRARRFDLTRVARYDPEKTHHDGWRFYGEEINLQTPYEYLKLQGYAVPVEAIMPGQTKTVAWQPYRDPRSKFHYPRLVRHPNPDIMKRINALLEQRHWRMMLGALECASSINGFGEYLGAYDDEKIKVDFLSETLMSVSEAGSTDCGGAHPNNHFEPFTLDLIRGEYLDWDRLFRAFTPTEYGGRKLSPEMLALSEQSAEHPEWFQGKEFGQGTGDNEDVGFFPTKNLYLHFDKPGHLALTVSGLGHCCAAGHGIHAEIPFSDLGTILKPEARRYFPEWKGKK